MKYLSHYTEEATTKLLTKYNGFFAFGQKQFDEAKKEGVKYVDRGAGLIHERLLSPSRPKPPVLPIGLIGPGCFLI